MNKKLYLILFAICIVLLSIKTSAAQQQWLIIGEKYLARYDLGETSGCSNGGFDVRNVEVEYFIDY